MRNPARKALYCLLILTLGAGLIWFGAERHEAVSGGWTSLVPILLGLAIVPFPLYILIEALFAVRGQARLLAGIGVIARWQVHPAEWEQFRKRDSRRAAGDLDLGNDLWIRKASPQAPVEIVVGEKSALVDGSYHSLSRRALPELREVRWLEGSPAFLEFALRYPRTRYGGTVLTTLRIPVPASARASAGEVLVHYQALFRPRPAIAVRNPPKTFRTRGFLVLLAAATAAIGYAVLRDLPAGARESILDGIAIGASVLVIFGGGIALATYLFAPRT